MKFIEHEDGIYVDVNGGSSQSDNKFLSYSRTSTNGHEYICRDKQVSDGCRASAPKKVPEGRKTKLNQHQNRRRNAKQADVE